MDPPTLKEQYLRSGEGVWCDYVMCVRLQSARAAAKSIGGAYNVFPRGARFATGRLVVMVVRDAVHVAHVDDDSTSDNLAIQSVFEVETWMTRRIMRGKRTL